MCLALGDDEITVFLCIPFVLDAERCRVIGNLDQVLIECQLTDLGSDQHSLLSLLNEVKVELFLGSHDLFLDEVLLREYLELWLLVLNQLLDSLLEKGLCIFEFFVV